ncbi:hypothetical protein RUM44_011373 [Polyplax serrata]|uniref:Aminopeptidase P N-terminal domain-containing protein n=1 Tax=Polyplax serrata TaxID=468196 RepID=A0ABR1ARC3_POLSC
MADEEIGKTCIEQLKKCQSFHLPNLDLPPWSPSPSFLAKFRGPPYVKKESLPCDVKKKIEKCLNTPRPKCQIPALSPSFIASFSAAPVGAFFSMGENTLKIPMVLFAENRKRLCRKLKVKVPKGAIVLLQGGDSLNLYSTDVEYVFRQEPYFNWTFGVREPGCYGVIIPHTGESILYVPRLPESYATWCGPLKTLCQFKQIYETNRVNYVDQYEG